MKNTLKFVSSLVLVSLFTIGANFSQTVTDIDGNIYNTVSIGTQVWMKENLKVTRYSNGDTIPNVPNTAAWSGLYTGARCYYNNDSTTYANTYGSLYNWYAAKSTKNICPDGWHVPTDDDWHKLILNIDPSAQLVLGEESSFAGGEIKDTTSFWQSPNLGATNNTGFTGIPAGFRNGYYYGEIDSTAYWWTKTKLPGIYPIYRSVSFDSVNIIRWGLIHQAGLSIRCVRDLEIGITKTSGPDDLIKIYPNPAKENITIKLDLPINHSSSTLLITNIQGKVVIEFEVSEIINVLDTSQLPGGIYFYSIEIGGKFITGKFIIND